jgi:hypothetical protein
LEIIFDDLSLEPAEEIYVTTTSNSPYVSGCVSSAIFKYCKPSRVLSPKTRAIVVIHEFGVPCKTVIQLKDLAQSRGIPLIEDCAHAIGSKIEGKEIGTIGDYAIFSLPKIFPVPYGGLLTGRNPVNKDLSSLKAAKIEQLKPALGQVVPLHPQYAETRRQNYQYLTALFESANLKPFFEVTADIVPYVFPLVTDNFEEIVEVISPWVESYIWHGNNIVILPVHQFVTSLQLDRLFEIFIKETQDLKDKECSGAF